jgi:DNA repair exonuclease SbcCD ATPase subunit
MKTIILKEMKLQNFKGVRYLHVNFDFRTDISGDNGVGKSTVFDAFCWLLFGKNSEDKKDFTIKTTDENGVAIPKLTHEVEAAINVDGRTITLKRAYLEKWVKKNGEAVEQFQGHTEQRYYNEVPCSAKEYDAKVRENICPEEVFKFITNPAYFPTRKEDVQRQLLFEMAGGVEDRDVAKGNKDFSDLLDLLTDKTMDEFRREIAAKKRLVKSDIESIPGRIDERKRDMTETPEDTQEAEAQLKEAMESRAKLSDKVSSAQAANEERMRAVKQLGDLQNKRIEYAGKLVRKARQAYDDALTEKDKVEAEIKRNEQAVQTGKNELVHLQQTLDGWMKQRGILLADWKRINEEIQTADAPISEADFICPTCGRRYEVDEIDTKRQEIIDKYLEGKMAEKNKNVERGKAVTKNMQDVEAQIATVKDFIKKNKDKANELRKDPRLTISVPEPEIDALQALVDTNEEIKKTDAEITRLKAFVEAPVKDKSDEELSAKRQELEDTVCKLTDFILKQRRIKEDNDKNGARIAELEKQLKRQNEELARLERLEFTAMSFSKARTRAIEDKINGLFHAVRFKLFDTQVNGAEVECCIPLVNGVPYPDANTAGKINAGLDIINAICKAKGIEAPIFIDGAESINHLTGTNSQVITLTVTKDKELTVHYGEAVEGKTLFDL